MMTAPPDCRPTIILLASTFPRWANDTEPRFILDFARQMSARFRIIVCAPHAPNAAREEELEGVRVVRYRYWIERWQRVAYEGGIVSRIRGNPLRALQLPALFFSQFVTLTRLVLKESPVLIHAHWLIPQGLVAVLAMRLLRLKVPLLCTSHGGDLYALTRFPFPQIKRYVIRSSDAVTVVSNAMARIVTTMDPHRAPSVIPMGADLRHLFTPADNAADSQSGSLLFVGRLVEKKGLEFLLTAISDLRTQLPRMRLRIVGDGPLRARLEHRTRELDLERQVEFCGAVPHSELPEFYRHSMAAVFPFVIARDGDQEGLGLVVAEALGCGCPVIASSLDAVRDTVRHNVTGLLVRPGEAGELADAIARLATDPPLRRRLAHDGRQFALQNFDWKIVGERYGEVYRSHMKRHVSQPE